VLRSLVVSPNRYRRYKLLRYFYIDRYLAITPDQAKEVGGNIWFNPKKGLYRAGYASTITYSLLLMATAILYEAIIIDRKLQKLSVFRMDVLHTLHCLNLLRMSQDRDHYVGNGLMPNGSNIRKHIGQYNRFSHITIL
jgi:hypothetical protein